MTFAMAAAMVACTQLPSTASIPEHCQTDPSGVGSVIPQGTRSQAYFDADPAAAGVQLVTGHLGSPSTESFVGATPPRATYSGRATIQTIANVETLLVEAVVQDDNTYPWASLRPSVVIEKFNGVETTFTPGTPGASFDSYCFSDVAPGTPTRAGYFRALIPVTGIGEPGFEVRAVVQAMDVLNLGHYLGADENTVKVGPPPADAGAVVDKAFGLVLDDSLIVDTNNSNDDLEGLINSKVLPQVRSKLKKLGDSSPGAQDGLVIPFKRDHEYPLPTSSNYSFVHFRAVNTGPMNLDLAFQPTLTAATSTPQTPVVGTFATFPFEFEPSAVPVPSGSLDDEARFRVHLSMPSFYLNGYLRFSPISGEFTLAGALDLDLTLAFNVVNGALTVDLDIVNVDFNLDANQTKIEVDQWAYRPFGAAIGNFVTSVVNKVGSNGMWDSLDTQLGLSGKLSDLINDNVLVPSMLRAQQLLSGGVTLPNGSGFTLPTFGFARTCDRMGCNGWGHGDVLMSQQGIEIGLKAAAQDRKAVGATRKFPKVYQPTTSSTVADMLADRIIPGTTTQFKAGLVVDGGFVNQLLRAVTEPSPTTGKGLLDTTISLAGNSVQIEAENAPIMVSQTFPGAAGLQPISVYLPNLQVTIAGIGKYSVDLMVGVGATLDPVTQKLRVAITAAYDVDTLSCQVDLNLICLLPQVVLDYLKGPLSQLLTDRTIGEFAVPQGEDLNVTAFQVARVGSNFGAYINLVGINPPAPAATITGGGRTNGSASSGSSTETHPDDWRFTVTPTPGTFQGTGPYTYEWKLYDSRVGGSAPAYSVTHTSTAGSDSITVAQPNNSAPIPGESFHNGHIRDYTARAEVTISRTDTNGRVWTLETQKTAYWGYEDTSGCTTVGC